DSVVFSVSSPADDHLGSLALSLASVTEAEIEHSFPLGDLPSGNLCVAVSWVGAPASPHPSPRLVCSSCKSAPSDSVLIPCAHSPLCSVCAASAHASPLNGCPICTTPIEHFAKIRFV
ncbi:MAG: RING-HC finger protein, partial [archaeon]|nr:RING-HC finger protein [archaeon]